MTISVDKTAFIDLYDSGKTQVIWEDLPFDLATPTSATLALKEEGAPFFLLESSDLGPAKGRYSIIGMDPDLTWCFDGESVTIDEQGQEKKNVPKEQCLSSFREIVKASQFDLPSILPDMASGLIGYMSYDMIRVTESRIPDNNPDPIQIPQGLYMRITSSLVFDSLDKKLYSVLTVRPQEDQTAEQAYDQALQKLSDLHESLKSAPAESRSLDSGSEELSFSSNMTKEDFMAMVNKAKSYIVEGDIFQVVPSQRFQAPFSRSPFSFYRSLRDLNPSPYLFFLQFGNFHLIGSSPEILVRVKDETVTIRPLAGTRKRGESPEEDAKIAEELLADQKEVSEHLMLVDLSRNDVGRVSSPGSVRVTEEMIIEYYSHVMHISSNVEGQLDANYDSLDALFSGLPVGTVSGAPKIRAMEIIDELEPQKRSFYAGCVGYFSANGGMDTCITLRTALIKDQQLYLQAGCGIVSDSDPELEFDETLNKAKALTLAAEQSLRFD